MINRILSFIILIMLLALISLLPFALAEEPKKKQTMELCPVIENGKWGYITKNGTMVVKPQFDRAWRHHEGMSSVVSGGKYGYVDNAGKVVIQPQFDDSLDFYESLAAVKIGSSWGYIDKTGKIAIQPQFNNANEFSEGLAAVSGKEAGHYIDTTGKVVINLPGNCRAAHPFKEGLAAVRIDDEYIKWGIY